MEGQVQEVLPATMFRVKLDNLNNIILAHLSGRMRKNNIKVLLGSIPPTATFSWAPAIAPAPRVSELNSWLREYAAEKNLMYIDYHTALAGPAGELRSELGNDGVHPNRDGYFIMRRLLEQALAQ